MCLRSKGCVLSVGVVSPGPTTPVCHPPRVSLSWVCCRVKDCVSSTSDCRSRIVCATRVYRQVKDCVSSKSVSSGPDACVIRECLNYGCVVGSWTVCHPRVSMSPGPGVIYECLTYRCVVGSRTVCHPRVSGCVSSTRVFGFRTVIHGCVVGSGVVCLSMSYSLLCVSDRVPTGRPSVWSYVFPGPPPLPVPRTLPRRPTFDSRGVTGPDP